VLPGKWNEGEARKQSAVAGRDFPPPTLPLTEFAHVSSHLTSTHSATLGGSEVGDGDGGSFKPMVCDRGRSFRRFGARGRREREDACLPARHETLTRLQLTVFSVRYVHTIRACRRCCTVSPQFSAVQYSTVSQPPPSPTSRCAWHPAKRDPALFPGISPPRFHCVVRRPVAPWREYLPLRNQVPDDSKFVARRDPRRRFRDSSGSVSGSDTALAIRRASPPFFPVLGLPAAVRRLRIHLLRPFHSSIPMHPPCPVFAYTSNTKSELLSNYQTV
jgi:hypothetical protein